MFFRNFLANTICWVGLSILVFLPAFIIITTTANVQASVADNTRCCLTIDVKDVTVNEVLLRIYLKTGYWVVLPEEFKKKKIDYHVVDANLKDSIKSLLKLVGVKNFALVLDEKEKQVAVFITESDDNTFDASPLKKKSKYVPTEYDKMNLPPGDLDLPSKEDLGPVKLETDMANYNIPPQDRILPKVDDLGPVLLETNVELSSIPPHERIWPNRQDLGPITMETDKSLSNIPPQDRAMPSAADLGI